MSLRVTANGVVQCGPGIFTLSMPPHRVRSFGASAPNNGPRSVLIIDGCRFDEKKKQLEFDLEQTMALNVGTSSSTIAIDSSAGLVHKTVDADDSPDEYGPGDRQFLQMVKSELSVEMADVAAKLLASIRQRSPGDLKKGQSRNFSETPDNFWYVIVQPRIDELSFTVRGPVSHFTELTDIEVKDDRGNSRFKVRSAEDIPAALKLIFHAIRKQ